MSRMIDDEEELKDNGLIEVDGCNVAECEFIDNGEVKNACKLGYWTDVLDYTPNCVNNKKCVFKKLALQLQRAKAELEQYKKSKQASYENMQEQWNKAVNELRDLKASDQIEFKQYYKAENDKLKAENEWLNNANRKFLLDKDFLTLELRDLRIEYALLHQENKKMKQALEDINLILCEGRTFYDGYFDANNLSRTDKAIKLINEVLNERVD